MLEYHTILTEQMNSSLKHKEKQHLISGLCVSETKITRPVFVFKKNEGLFESLYKKLERF